MEIAMRMTSVLLLLGMLFSHSGCRTTESQLARKQSEPTPPARVVNQPSSELERRARAERLLCRQKPSPEQPPLQKKQPIELVSLIEPEPLPLPAPNEAERQPYDNASATGINQSVDLEDVIASVYATYPLLQAAYFNRNIAQGEYLSAQGNFDLKLKAASENGPTGFYQTYRQGAGFDQPTLWGGSVFGGYRIGRGDFQPWYLERQTNDGGEFKAGVSIPLLQGREIDPRRAELWSASWGTHLPEPQIQQQLIEYVYMASNAYWEWVAAGLNLQINENLLELAKERNVGIQKQVEVGTLGRPDLKDNRRSIVSREAKVIDARRKFQQTSFKLSIFLRDPTGEPIVLSDRDIPEFPPLEEDFGHSFEADIQQAIANRPELQELDLVRRQLDIDRSLANNDLLPSVDAVIFGSQDVGEPTSSKRDKSEFELEAAVLVDVPLQRRKARGKIQSIEGKLSQLVLKRGLIEDKIVADLQNVHAALAANREAVYKAREAVVLANYMAEVERTKFEAGAGESSLFTLNLREQQAAETAISEVLTTLDYFRAQAEYRAVLAIDHQNAQVRE